jgi:membrane fusion protein (multidrug efflux system)
MKNMKYAVVGFTALIAVGISNGCLANKGAAAATTPAMPPTIVETTIVKTTTQQQQLSATGTLLSIPGIIVRPEISGRITNIFFKPGEKVNKDAPLIEINHDITAAQLEDAKANLELQQFNFERSNKLYKTRTIAKADYDKSLSDLE